MYTLWRRIMRCLKIVITTLIAMLRNANCFSTVLKCPNIDHHWLERGNEKRKRTTKLSEKSAQCSNLYMIADTFDNLRIHSCNNYLPIELQEWRFNRYSNIYILWIKWLINKTAMYNIAHQSNYKKSISFIHQMYLL